jgi:hypothetical protein
VSSEQQTDHGVSLQAQEDKIRQYCALYDLTLVYIITDAGVSAKTLQREGLQKALSMLTSAGVRGWQPSHDHRPRRVPPQCTRLAPTARRAAGDLPGRLPCSPAADGWARVKSGFIFPILASP